MVCAYIPPEDEEPPAQKAEERPMISDEVWWGELEMIAQVVEAEAGNQDLTGKRLVADVVLNRVESPNPIFPDSIGEVIFQENQFSVIKNGMYDAVRLRISDESYLAVNLEAGEERLNKDILWFSRGKSPWATYHFKHQDHWFGW